MFIFTMILILNNLKGPAFYKLCFSVGPSISITRYFHCIYYNYFNGRINEKNVCLYTMYVIFYTLFMDGNENKLELN